MTHKFFYLLLLSGVFLKLSAQPTIYKDVQTLITGTWANANDGTASIQEENGQNPYEGNNNYRFDYNFSNWWAGCGLNMDNWGTTAARDFSGYTHLRIAYYGLSADSELRVLFKNGSNASNSIEIGGNISSYQVVDVPIAPMLEGTAVTIDAIREIQLFVSGIEAANSSFYFDAIELVVSSDVSSPASAATWALANSVNLGVNYANWLEAHWLIEFNSFPEVDKYNRANVQALKEAGFEIVRLPVTFERMSPITPPYTIDFNHQALKLLDSVILWAAEYDFKLIIDNHHGYELTDDNFNAELPRLEALWAQIASRYHDLDRDRYLFEVYNEPHSISNSNFRTVAQALVDVVRASETTTHSIVVGASGYNSGSNLAAFVPLNDADIIYGFHNYDPYLFTHQGMSWTTPAYFPVATFPHGGEVDAINSVFSAVKAWSITNDVPVWLGEYGVAASADETSKCSWMETIVSASETNGFAHFYWNAITPVDAYGFFEEGNISPDHVIACFRDEMGLYNSILPIRFLNIEVRCEPNRAIVSWKAEVSAEVYTFDLQRSKDGVLWTSVAELKSRNGLQEYNVQDIHAAAFYRVETISSDDLHAFSPIISSGCYNSSVDQFVISPHPAQNWFQIDGLGRNHQAQRVEIYNMSGQLYQSINIKNNSDLIDVSGLPEGQYVLQLRLSDGAIWHKLMVVIR